MRHRLIAAFACLAGSSLVPALASAQQPVSEYPYDVLQPVRPPGNVIPPGPVVPAQAAPTAPAQPPVAAPPPPPGYYYPPPAYYYPPPGYPQAYPPPNWAPPVAPARPAPAVVAPAPKPPATNARGCTATNCNRPAEYTGRNRRFGIGVHFTDLMLNQTINNQQVNLMGAGIDIRLRTPHSFAFEISGDYLHGDFKLNGPVARDSIPVQATMLFYVFQNRDTNHFNIYFGGGTGVVPTTMALTSPTGAQVKQNFTEFDGHLVVGAELRFSWLTLTADLRGLWLFRTNDQDAKWYGNIDGAPVPPTSQGLMTTIAGRFSF